MIIYLKGDLFNSPAKVLVNTVNTVGVMGKGIAKEFKNRYPDMFKQYQKICEEKRFNIGDLMLWKSKDKWILLFPTKQHWRNESKLEYIEAGLKRFVKGWDKHSIESIAFPKLGCGNGALKWEEVKPLMEKYLKPLPLKIYIYVDDYKETKPEHSDIELMERWLEADPQNLGFSALRDIIEKRFTTAKAFKLLDGEKYSAIWEKNQLVIQNGEKHIISEEELCEFWSLVRDLGIVRIKNLPSKFMPYARFLLELFMYMNYMEPIIVSEDGVEFDKTSNGYQYTRKKDVEFGN